MIIKFENIQKPTAAIHRIRRSRKQYCHHTEISLDELNGQVQCKKCKEFLNPFVALQVIARGSWWEEMKLETALELEAKRVARVQSAAIEHLYNAGITPEKYRIRWEKEDAKAKALAQLSEVSIAPVEAMPDKTAS